jgi:predicted TIM-barrel fold metal-dependent hydrolase/type 1 glutamine amidotransferase
MAFFPGNGEAKATALALIGDPHHSPDTSRIALTQTLVTEAGLTIDFTTDVTLLNATNLNGYNLLILFRDGFNPDNSFWMTAAQGTAVKRFVRSGGSILFYHNSSHIALTNDSVKAVLGGVYAGHPAIRQFALHLTDANSPISRGVSDFTVTDEQHYPVYYGDSSRIFMTCVNENGLTFQDDNGQQRGTTAVAGWAFPYGAGRVCYLSPGHTLSTLRNPEYVKIQKNAVSWLLPRRPIIDAHIHLYDPYRVGGVPWPTAGEKGQPYYKTILPDTVKAVATPVGTAGAIAIECSEWPEDNQWVLDRIGNDPFFYGLVGNLKPGDTAYDSLLNRFSKNKKFLGIRLRTQGIHRSNLSSAMIDDFKALKDSGMVLDILLTPESDVTLDDAKAIAEKIPGLPIMLDHCACANINGMAPDPSWVSSVRLLAQYPNVFCKISSLFGRSAQKPAPTALPYYTPVLDSLYKIFGQDRLVYASNWPVLMTGGNYADHQSLIVSYYQAKADSIAEKVLWKNAEKFYHISNSTTRAVTINRTDAVIKTKTCWVTRSAAGYFFRWRLAQPGPVSLRIYTLSGQNIFSMGKFCPYSGAQSFFWNIKSSFGRQVLSGTYLYRLCSGMHDESGALIAVF